MNPCSYALFFPPITDSRNWCGTTYKLLLRMKVEDSLSQNMEEISQGNPEELTKIFQGFSTELEEMFQENSHRLEPTEVFSLRSESIGESCSVKTEEVMYHVIQSFSCPASFLFCYLERLVRSHVLSTL